jgi:uncharacterized protein YbjT (DUF2867 family)
LLARGISAFACRALVRNAQAEAALRQYLGPVAACLEFLHGDICTKESLEYAFRGIDALIITTGPKAQVDMASLLGEQAWGALSLGYSKVNPSFWYAAHRGPSDVGWIGQSNQIDEAKRAGAKHIILVSSMGGTKPDHLLNEKMSNVALWKRKAEHHLVNSGVPFTIIRAGGLYAASLPEEHFGSMQPAANEICVGVDDRVEDGEWELSPVPPDDIALLCSQSLEEPGAVGRSFDIWNRSSADTSANGNKQPSTQSVQNCDIPTILAKLKGKNGRYKEQPYDPNFSRRRGGGLSERVMRLSSQSLMCAPSKVCSCNDAFSRAADERDAEAPGMTRVFDDRSFRSNPSANATRERFQSSKADLNAPPPPSPHKHKIDDHFQFD